MRGCSVDHTVIDQVLLRTACRPAECLRIASQSGNVEAQHVVVAMEPQDAHLLALLVGDVTQRREEPLGVVEHRGAQLAQHKSERVGQVSVRRVGHGSSGSMEQTRRQGPALRQIAVAQTRERRGIESKLGLRIGLT